MQYKVQKGDTLWLIAKKYGVSLEDLIQANPIISDPDYIQEGLLIEIPRKPNVHVVKKGDTMWLIAKKYGVSLEDLIEANPKISDPNKIDVNMEINIPGGVNAPYHYSGNTSQMNKNTAPKYPTPNMASSDKSTAGMTAQNMTGQSMINQNMTSHIQGSAGMPAMPTGLECPDHLKSLCYVVKTGDTLSQIAKMFEVPLQKLISSNPHIDPKKVSPGNKIFVPVEKGIVEKKYDVSSMEKAATQTPEMSSMSQMPMGAQMPSSMSQMPPMLQMPAMPQICPMLHKPPCMGMMNQMQMAPQFPCFHGSKTPCAMGAMPNQMQQSSSSKKGCGHK